MRVQVVDDNEILRTVACLEVEMAEGLELVGSAADGAEAIDVARAARPDVILLDLDMPVMSGMEALPHLVEVVPDAVIVIYTSHDSRQARSDARRLGAGAYVMKQVMPVRDVLALVVAGTAPA